MGHKKKCGDREENGSSDLKTTQKMRVCVFLGGPESAARFSHGVLSLQSEFCTDQNLMAKIMVRSNKV